MPETNVKEKDEVPSRTTTILRWIAKMSWPVLLLYWLMLTIATHLPPSSVELPSNSDKPVHTLSYATLGVLAAVAWRANFGRFHRGTGLLLLVGLSAFGALDELTQPFFHRSADLNDWAADTVGVAIGLVLFRIALAIYEACRARQAPTADTVVN